MVEVDEDFETEKETLRRSAEEASSSANGLLPLMTPSLDASLSLTAPLVNTCHSLLTAHSPRPAKPNTGFLRLVALPIDALPLTPPPVGASP
jgi:hypothetical protein